MEPDEKRLASLIKIIFCCKIIWEFRIKRKKICFEMT